MHAGLFKRKYPHELANLKLQVITVAQKWSINPEFLKTCRKKVKQQFCKIYTNKRFRYPESFFEVNVLYRVLDIIIDQLGSRFFGINETVSNFSVL